MQEAHARHTSPPPPKVPKGDLLTQLKTIGPDPDLWHEVMLTMDFDAVADLAVVDWIVSEPECDRATLRSLGMSINIFEYLAADMAVARPEVAAIARKMMVRWAAGVFTSDELAEANPEQDPNGYELLYRRTETVILAEGGQLPWPYPVDFFRRNVGRVPNSRYKMSRDKILVASASTAVRKPPAPGWEGFDAAITP